MPSSRNSTSTPSEGLLAPALLALALLLGGCVTPFTVATGERVTSGDGTMATTAPAGWVIIGGPKSRISLTYDGPLVQQIELRHAKLAKAFSHTEVAASTKMLPNELMDYYLADLQKELGTDGVTVLSRGPATLGGQPGFRLETEFVNEDGLGFRVDTVGAVTADGFFVVRYLAPRVHYHQRDRAVYEQVLAATQLL